MPNFLGEFLQEEQEPFSLEAYLLERGCTKGTSCLNPRSLFLYSSKILKDRGHFIPNCSNFVKAVFKQIGSVKTNPKIKNSRDGDQVDIQDNATGDKFLWRNSRMVFNLCAESEVEDAHSVEESGKLFLEEEVDADGKLKWGGIEDNRQQLSPVSVLEVAEPDEKSSLHYSNIKKTTQGESSTTRSQFKSNPPTHYSVQVTRQIPSSNLYAQHIKNKRALRQTKQLLIDCVREVFQNYRKQNHVKKILGADELWRLVCENVWLWSQDSIHEMNIIHLLRHDFLASAEEWVADYEGHKKGMWMDVGDAILDDIINEIVTY